MVRSRHISVMKKQEMTFSEKPTDSVPLTFIQISWGYCSKGKQNPISKSSVLWQTFTHSTCYLQNHPNVGSWNLTFYLSVPFFTSSHLFTFTSICRFIIMTSLFNFTQNVGLPKKFTQDVGFKSVSSGLRVRCNVLLISTSLQGARKPTIQGKSWDTATQI
jgi:hypothetical protein